MSAVITHKLNQPLAAIVNYCNPACHLLQKSEISVEIVVAGMKAAEQARRVASFVTRMRSLNNHHHPHFASEGIDTTIQEAVTVALTRQVPSDVNTLSTLVPNPPRILVAREQIQQVPVNLIRNAVDAMSTSTSREIGITTIVLNSATKSAGEWSRTRHFERHRGRSVHAFFTTKVGGMGMDISQPIVENHQGRIVIAPNPGSGTIFKFGLPAPVAD